MYYLFLDNQSCLLSVLWGSLTEERQFTCPLPLIESKRRRMSKEGRINQLDENEGWYGFHSDAREDEQLRAARHVGEGEKGRTVGGQLQRPLHRRENTGWHVAAQRCGGCRTLLPNGRIQDQPVEVFIVTTYLRLDTRDTL